MTKTETIQACVDLNLKREAEGVFAELGLSATEAITLFYQQVILHRGLPFRMKVPNAETLEALQRARDGVGLMEYAGLHDIKAEFD